ncbi:putative molybdenum carrier [compost metagenome]
MQYDFFNAPAAAVPQPPITLREHASSDYGPRTGENARGADVTVAFATDFSTAGERLTERVAGRRKYVGIAYGSDIEKAADELAQFMAASGAKTLNVAGNGIYTLTRQGITQAMADRWVYEVLKRVHERIGLTAIRSGGQTGVDTSGLVAGMALGIPVTGLYPKGFRRRLENNRDVTSDEQTLLAELKAAAQALRG